MADRLNSKVKPLLAALKRIRIGRFLKSEEFELWALENNRNQDWKKYLAQANEERVVYGIDDTEFEELALGLWFSRLEEGLYSSERDAVITELLKEFLSWSQQPIDLLPTLKVFRNLDIDKGKIKGLADFSRQRRAQVLLMASDQEHQKDSRQKFKTMPAHTDLSNKVFIVHGHADADRTRLCMMLKEELGLQPIVLQDEPSTTLETILNKVERLAEECHAAIIMLTPDDVTTTGARARQNVILELGYFLGLWRSQGNRRIMVLKKGNLEVPSDISGVLYFDYHADPQELHLKLMKQFEAWGFKLKK